LQEEKRKKADKGIYLHLVQCTESREPTVGLNSLMGVERKRMMMMMIWQW